MENKELLEYRANLLEHIRAVTHEFIAACRQAPDPFAPLAAGSWNLHQLVAHVWDVDQRAYGLRVRLTIQQDHPTFPNYDGDAWMAGGYSPEVPVDRMLAELDARIDEMLVLLGALPPAAWNRLGRHEIQGDQTLQTWVERSLAHIEEHLETLKSGQA